jgi:hypothetical protein
MKDWFIAFLAAVGLVGTVVFGVRELLPFILAISR